MDWITALAIVCITAGVTISVVVLVAVGSIRRSLNETSLRHALHIKRLSESIATLTSQQQAAQADIQALSTANRHLSDTVAALNERLADGEVVRRSGGPARLLH